MLLILYFYHKSKINELNDWIKQMGGIYDNTTKELPMKRENISQDLIAYLKKQCALSSSAVLLCKSLLAGELYIS